jgi:hypothetical protein
MELDHQEQGIMTVNQMYPNITRKLAEGLLCVCVVKELNLMTGKDQELCAKCNRDFMGRGSKIISIL